MVYESDFYTTRRPYSRPTVTSYSVTRREVPWHMVPTVPRPSQVPPCFTAYGSRGFPTPRHYVVLDTPDRPRRAEEQYSYSYTQESSDTRYDSSSPYSSSVPTRSYSSSSERVSRSTGSGPGNYSYTTERSSRSSDLPGGYHSSYSSTTSGRLPHVAGFLFNRIKKKENGEEFQGSDKKATPYHKNIPYIGHKRLVIVQPSAHGWRVKQSVLLGEIDRIYHKVRPSLAYQPKEDYLNSRSIMSFDDETRSIRAKTAELLKKIHTPVPRAQRPLPLPGEAIDEFLRLRHELSNVAMKLIFYPTTLDNDRLYYSHTELPITERITSNSYIDRLLAAPKGVTPISVPPSHYDDSRQYSRMGKGHLACLTYAGGRPISRRKNLASVEDYIRDDINVLSHYNRFRQAAEKAPHMPDTEYGSIPHRPPTKSPITGSWKSNAPRRTQSDKETVRVNDISAGDDDTEAQERKRKRREAVEEAALKEEEEEKRRNQELRRQEELAEQAAAERQAELERKAQEEEERLEALRKAQEEEERRAREEEEARIAKEEEERKAMEAEKKAEAKRKAKEEAARRAEEERKAREEEERRLKEEEERKAREEEERRQREEEERKAREEEERRLKEEEERLAREEEERRLKEEEERKAEEERLAKEEEERKALEEQQAQEAEPAEEEQEQEQPQKEEKPEEPEETEDKPQAEEVNEPETEETGNEPLIEEPQTPDVSPVKPTAEDEEEEEEEEEDED